MNKENYDRLVKNSKDISNKWMKLPAPQRGEYIRLFGEELRNKKENLAKTMSKSFWDNASFLQTKLKFDGKGERELLLEYFKDQLYG